MYINHRHYILLIFAIATALMSGMGYTFLYRTVMSQSAQATELKAQVALENEKKNHETNAAGIYKQSSIDRSRVGDFIVSQDKIVDFIETIEKIGEEAGAPLALSVIATEDLSAKPENSIGTFTAHVESSGSWASVMRALMLVENMPYSVSLNAIRLRKSSDVSLEKDKSKGGSNEWNMSFTIRALTIK